MKKYRSISINFRCVVTLLLLTVCMAAQATTFSLPSLFKSNNDRSFGDGNISISVPSQINVQSIDGNDIRLPSYIDGFYTIRLNAGKHVLVAQYFENWNTIEEGGGNLIKWQPTELVIDINAANNYSINYKKPYDVEEAEALIGEPELWIESENDIVAKGVVLEKAEPVYQRRSIASNTHQYSTESNNAAAAENAELKAEVEALKKQMNEIQADTQRAKAVNKPDTSFESWQQQKSKNSDDYQKFKQYQEYQQWLEYKRKNLK